MSSAEESRVWEDVQHPIDPHALPESAGAAGLRDPARASALRDAAGVSARRRAARISEREAVATLSRAHAAGFADAFDLDGAFGAPARARAGVEVDADGGHVIVLERSGFVAADEWASDEDVVTTPARRRTLTLVTDDDPVDDVDEWDDDAAGTFDRPATSTRRERASARRPAERTSFPRRELEPLRGKAFGERFALRPDRMGLYTVLLGIFLVILAAASSGHA